jgi:hypothetical protein
MEKAVSILQLQTRQPRRAQCPLKQPGSCLIYGSGFELEHVTRFDGAGPIRGLTKHDWFMRQLLVTRRL